MAALEKIDLVDICLHTAQIVQKTSVKIHPTGCVILGAPYVQDQSAKSFVQAVCGQFLPCP